MSVPYASEITGPGSLPDFRLHLLSLWKGPLNSLGALVHPNEEFGVAGVEWEINTLKGVSLWWISEEVCELLRHAAPQMPAQVLRRDDPFEESGLVYFEVPMYGQDSENPEKDAISYRAIMWGPAYIIPNPRLGWPGGEALAIQCWELTDLDRWIDQTAMPGARSMWVPLGTSHWSFGDHTDQAPFEMEPHRLASWAEDRRMLAALWSIAAQPISQVEKKPPERHARKRSERAGVPVDHVNVVTLPRRGRKGAGEAGHRDVEWSRRWIVSGHWRNQWLPSKQDHRLQWINPYPKGPEDKPLVMKDRVYKVAPPSDEAP